MEISLILSVYNKYKYVFRVTIKDTGHSFIMKRNPIRFDTFSENDILFIGFRSKYVANIYRISAVRTKNEKYSWKLVEDAEPSLENILEENRQFTKQEVYEIMNQFVTDIKYLQLKKLIHDDAHQGNICIQEAKVGGKTVFKVKEIDTGSMKSFRDKYAKGLVGVNKDFIYLNMVFPLLYSHCTELQTNPLFNISSLHPTQNT